MYTQPSDYKWRFDLNGNVRLTVDEGDLSGKTLFEKIRDGDADTAMTFKDLAYVIQMYADISQTYSGASGAWRLLANQQFKSCGFFSKYRNNNQHKYGDYSDYKVGLLNPNFVPPLDRFYFSAAGMAFDRWQFFNLASQEPTINLPVGADSSGTMYWRRFDKTAVTQVYDQFINKGYFYELSQGITRAYFGRQDYRFAYCGDTFNYVGASNTVDGDSTPVTDSGTIDNSSGSFNINKTHYAVTTGQVKVGDDWKYKVFQSKSTSTSTVKLKMPFPTTAAWVILGIEGASRSQKGGSTTEGSWCFFAEAQVENGNIIVIDYKAAIEKLVAHAFDASVIGNIYDYSERNLPYCTFYSPCVLSVFAKLTPPWDIPEN